LLFVFAPQIIAQTLSPCQVATYLRNVGIPEYDVGKLTCASLYESSRNCQAVGTVNPDGSQDYGVLQVNSKYWCSASNGVVTTSHPGCHMTCSQVVANCANGFACAKIVYDAQGVTAWYGYSGHRSTCDAYQAPASCGTGGGSAPGPAMPPGPVSCSFNGVTGVCSVQGDCQAAGKLWTPSSSGASGCESQPNNVLCCTNPNNLPSSVPEASVWGPCKYRGKSGSCVSSCSGGQFRSSAQGAHGCQAFPNAVKCCLASSQLIGDVYSGFQSSSMPVNNLGVIIGAVIAGVVVLGVAVAIAVVCFMKRSKRVGGAIEYANPTFSDVVVKEDVGNKAAGTPTFL